MTGTAFVERVLHGQFRLAPRPRLEVEAASPPGSSARQTLQEALRTARALYQNMPASFMFRPPMIVYASPLWVVLQLGTAFLLGTSHFSQPGRHTVHSHLQRPFDRWSS